MKTVIRIAIMILSLYLSAFSCQGSEGEVTLEVGYFDFPGLTYTDENGKAAGFVNEITKKTLENTGFKFTITRYPAARLYKYLSNGRVHVFNGLSSIPIVNTSCISSKIPLFPLEMRAYRLRGTPPVSHKEDLVGHSVILVRGFTYKDWGAWIKDSKNKVVFYETESHEAAFEMLQKGRAEYVLNYKYIDEEVLNRITIPALVIDPIFNWYCYFNINKNTPNAESILKTLEQSYLELIRSGKLRKFE